MCLDAQILRVMHVQFTTQLLYKGFAQVVKLYISWSEVYVS